MRFNAFTHRCCSWIAVLAILVSALAPAVSHAFSPLAGVQWIEVCTVDGVGLTQVADRSEGDGSERAPHFATEHCPYCFTHAGSFGLTRSQAFPWPLAGERISIQVSALPFPPIAFPRIASLPRAPPALA